MRCCRPRRGGAGDQGRHSPKDYQALNASDIRALPTSKRGAPTQDCPGRQTGAGGLTTRAGVEPRGWRGRHRKANCRAVGPFRHQFPSRCRTMAGLSGFLILSQSRDGPERYGAVSRFDTMPFRPILQACSNTSSLRTSGAAVCIRSSRVPGDRFTLVMARGIDFAIILSILESMLGVGE